MEKYHYQTIDSTSSFLKRNYDKYEDKTFISASFQSEGRGRYNREWISNNGENLLFSILIKDRKIINKFDGLSLSSAVCIYKFLKQINLNNISIKWPNDVYVGDKKICGILLESISFSNNIEAIVIGVGLNVNSKELPFNSATSIYIETGKNYNLEDLKGTLYNDFLTMLEEIKNDNKSYLKIIRDNNYLLNKDVKVKGEIVKVIGIDDDNSLIVDNGDKIYNVYSGEVTFTKEDI